MFFIYNTLLLTFILMGLPVWLPLVLYSEKRRKSLGPRLWIDGPPQAGSTHFGGSIAPIWVHALSVGEVLSVVPLMQRLKTRFPRRPIFLSVSTLTGFHIARERLQSTATWIGFFPLDLPTTVRRAVAAVNPALVLIVETDIWPNFMREINRRRVPVLLVNARLSERSLRGYRLFSFFFRPLFSSFTGVCAQSGLDVERFSMLGFPAEKMYQTGNLKFDQPPKDPSELTVSALRQSLGIDPGRPVVVAGSTHEGEEKLLLGGMRQLKRRRPAPAMILAPRDPARAASVYRLTGEFGLCASLLSDVMRDPGNRDMEVIVVDLLGRLRSLYALAEVAFVGGSLVRQRGHNPLEPAAWGKPVLFGPDMSDFLSISSDLLSAGAALSVQDTGTFSRTVNRLLDNRGEAEQMGQRALEIYQSQGGAAERITELVGELMGRGER